MIELHQIKTDQLTHYLYQAGEKKARWEREFIVKENTRLIVLAELTAKSTESSHAGAEREARTTKEYKGFIIELGEIKEKLILSRTWHNAIEFEIRMRLAKQFQDRAEFKGGGLNT